MIPQLQQGLSFSLREDSENASSHLEMGVHSHFLTCLTVISLACLARCDTPGIIFPANETSLHTPLSDLTIHFNDSIVVEYTTGPGEIVLLGQSCYASSQNPQNESSNNPQTFYPSSSCK
jgi:hypothetical protein